jgi:hypothetical protein
MWGHRDLKDLRFRNCADVQAPAYRTLAEAFLESKSGGVLIGRYAD